ncbi:MAG: PQQ-binding-like beta-propeller repeat protein [Coriobacteriaceae bacterium]|nr:PQQ-binding-like beta-propeller repeat protein [Coriobacteriaceae bacterium]
MHLLHATTNPAQNARRRTGTLCRLAVACVGAWALLAGPVAVCAVEPAPAPASTFKESYTAWEGYASTAAESMVPGAVPVKAPASASVEWDARDAGLTGALALRQVGQSTYLFALAHDELIKLDAATGSRIASVDLASPADPRASLTFVDGTLAVALADGRVSLYDDELKEAWTSRAPHLPAHVGSWGPSATPASGAGAVFTAAVARPAQGGAPMLCVSALASVDGAELWSATLESSGAEPRLFLASDESGASFLVLSDGSACVRGLDVSTGEVLWSTVLPDAVRGRISSAPTLGPDVLVAATDRDIVTLRLSRAAPAKVSTAAIAAPATARVSASPQVVSGHVLAPVAISAEGAAGPSCAIASVAVNGRAQLDGSTSRLSRPAAGDPAGAPVAVVFGDTVRDATVELVQQLVPGGLAVWALDPQGAPRDADPVLNRSVALRPGASAVFSSSAPVPDRTGAVYLVRAQDEPQIVALTPDASRACSTPTGGSEGLDTFAAALAGLQLPNGAGLGVGVVFFAGIFAAYVLIRNRGGKSSRDEGVAQWRHDHPRDARVRDEEY